MRIDLEHERKTEAKGRKGRRYDSALTMPRLARKPALAPRGGVASAEVHRPASPGVLRSGLAAGWKVARRRLLWIALLGLLVSLLTWLSVDERFFVYQARVIGARSIKAVDIYQVAGIHEQNIFWLQPDAVADRVLGLQGIKRVRVSLRLPSTVTIEVQERQPRVMWRLMAQQQDLWLDTEGVVLPYHGDTKAPETIFVVDGSDRQLAVGERLEPDDLVHSVVQLCTGIPGLRVLYLDPERGLSYVQVTGDLRWPVYVGTSEHLARKIDMLAQLTRYLVEKGIEPRYVDVRWADRPVYGKPVASGGGGE